ncbi:MAG: DUF4404 family protein [Pseudomonadales bacterium]|nr:DUF4404 family protein [Pseudomonadales bacterium]MCP5170672.1 DUF4404 family protein [Pseudomonadales bacterium]MCP5302087.1 DUF4404 family protein [Pseudomonadales bacterium]MCP5303534.1 DUF4404 family protein [Pseudomonadales bacterium]
MSDNELRNRLQDLHEELERASKLSTEERDVLGSLMTEMVEIANEGELASQQPDSLMDQLEEQVNEFENRHPRLAGVLRQIIEALGKMGI